MNNDTISNRIEAAILKTEYKYFGDYEMSDDQRQAVDVLVALARAHLASLPAIVTALRQAEAAPGVVDPIVRWIDQAIERCNKHGNTEGIWLFASQWQTVRDILALARQYGAREGYVLVPKEPTEAMLDALHSSVRIKVVPYKLAADIQNEREVYAAMLAAAPATDVGEEA